MNASLPVRAAPVLFLLLWSGGFTVAKIGIGEADPLTLLALRYCCVIALLLPFCLRARPALPATRAEWTNLALVGFLIQVVYFGTAWSAFELGGSAGTVALITSLQPILVALVMPRLVGNSILAISLLLMMIRNGEATRVSALFFLVPPVSAVIAWLVLGERMAPLAWLGMGVAAVGVWLVTRLRAG